MYFIEYSYVNVNVSLAPHQSPVLSCNRALDVAVPAHVKSLTESGSKGKQVLSF